MYETIKIERDARGVAELILARPEKHNAMSAQMIREIRAAAIELGDDASVRVVVLRAEGKSFCAGGDLRWMQDQMAADRATRAREARSIADMLGALNSLPKPLIGRLQGNAIGGGVGMACVCDIAIADEGAKFGLTETRLGLIPATIGPYVLARMGEANARRVFMNSRVFKADEAVALGIIARAVKTEDLDAAVEAEVLPYLSCAPGAVAAAKALARKLGADVGEAQIAHSVKVLIEQWEGEEAGAGIAAFFAKEAPPWVG
ncbi:MAG: methylglutaconyl-CoA hydratase [Halocynthiibacter sp.]|jgi:methylglutaconyl-CoA hydratase